MSTNDPIFPNFPPVAEPALHYEYLASIPMAEADLKKTCVKEVVIAGISSIEENTVEVEYETNTYGDIPVWIHTDTGTRQKEIDGTPATTPKEYFAKAATIWPFGENVKCIDWHNEIPSFDSYEPKALALISGDDNTPIAVISALSSVDKIKGYNYDELFPTWIPYIAIRIKEQRLISDNDYEYYWAKGIARDELWPYTGTPEIRDLFQPVVERLILWDFYAGGVAVIPDSAGTGTVNADTGAAVSPATIAEIDAFLPGALIAHFYAEDFNLVREQPYIDAHFHVMQSDEGEISAGTYFDGYDYSYAWGGTVTKSSPSLPFTQSSNLSSLWGDAIGSYIGTQEFFSAYSCQGYGGFDVNATITLDKWGVGSLDIFADDRLKSYFNGMWIRPLAGRNQYTGEPTYAHFNFRSSFTVNGDNYVVEKYLKDLNTTQNRTEARCGASSNSSVATHSTDFDFYFEIKKNGSVLEQDFYAGAISSEVSFTGGPDWTGHIERYAYGSSEPITTLDGSFLGNGGIIVDSSRTFKITSDFVWNSTNVETVIPTIALTEEKYTLNIIGLGRYAASVSAIKSYIDSIFSDFYTAPDENAPVLVRRPYDGFGDESAHPVEGYYLPDCIQVTDVDLVFKPYQLTEKTP